MKIEIIAAKSVFKLSGFAGVAINKDYTGTAFKLMDKMWEIVRANKLQHKGLTIWAYEQNENVSAGVELNGGDALETGLENTTITLEKYAYYKHIGSYNLINRRERL